jgi:hypothetical protein
MSELALLERGKRCCPLHKSLKSAILAPEIWQMSAKMDDPAVQQAHPRLQRKAMDALIELASLTDREAEDCLNRILSSFNETNPEIPITSPNDLGGILRGAATTIGAVAFAPKSDANLADRAKATRLILLEFCEEQKLRDRFEAALSADRRVLVDPITVSLVMAGIVVVLSTRYEMKYKRGKDGRSEFEVSLDKKPASEALIKKFFSLF